ncbi:MAG TPA: O-methyltransferase [Acidobacteriota bacterium]|nr:O-methyltransferase [Acidobacteriota bacterium]
MFDRIHAYLSEITPERPPVLREMEQRAAEDGFPIVGPLVGRFLYQMVLVIKARRILELGSGFGYSACWFSLAARSKGEITLTDLDAANKRLAFSYFKQAGLQSHFDFRVGNALNIARRLSGQYDILLNDINKEDYPKTLDLAARLLRRGGLFITDNMIWSGRVLAANPDKASRAIVEFTRSLYQDGRFFTTVLPIRDGLGVAVRL